jgi:hypothetical protein
MRMPCNTHNAQLSSRAMGSHTNAPCCLNHAGAVPPSVSSAEVVNSLGGLLQEVQADAAFW